MTAGAASEPTEEEVRALWAQNLRTKREAAGLSQGELAKLSGVHQTGISSIERGIHGGTIITRYRLARAFALQIDDVFPNPRVPESQLTGRRAAS